MGYAREVWSLISMFQTILEEFGTELQMMEEEVNSIINL